MVVGSKVLEKWWGLHNNIRAQVLVSISARTGLKPRMQGAWKPLNLREHQRWRLSETLHAELCKIPVK
jgi:hypothetical protein